LDHHGEGMLMPPHGTRCIFVADRSPCFGGAGATFLVAASQPPKLATLPAHHRRAASL
jgi:hypothetical protein